MEKTKDNFIMLPTIDFCFKELMQNPKVRKGFIAALLGKKPEEIKETILLPTILRQESENDKFGILDVRILLEDETQVDLEMQVAYFDFWTNRVIFYLGKMYTGQVQKGDSYNKLKKCIHVSLLDFIHFPNDKKCYRTIRLCDVEDGEEYTDLLELQILELPKLPQEVKDGEAIIQWMRFFSSKNQEEFEIMAKENEYFDEAYEALKKMSADDQKRLEYEAREKALMDYNTQMFSAYQRGNKEGRELTKQIFKLDRQGRPYEEIAEICGISVEEVEETLL